MNALLKSVNDFLLNRSGMCCLNLAEIKCAELVGQFFLCLIVSKIKAVQVAGFGGGKN